METFRELLACPACGGGLASDWSCVACPASFAAPDGIPALYLPGDACSEAVRSFYDRSPFPGYPARDSLFGLRQRAERSAFARLLDRAIAADRALLEGIPDGVTVALHICRGNYRSSWMCEGSLEPVAERVRPPVSAYTGTTRPPCAAWAPGIWWPTIWWPTESESGTATVLRRRAAPG